MGNQNSLTVHYCGLQQCGPGHSFGPAQRTHYLLHFIFSGEGDYHENGNIHHLTAGDVFLIRPGEATLYQADRNNPWQYGWVGFDGIDDKKILEQCNFSGNCFVCFRDYFDEIQAAFTDLINIYLLDRNTFLLLSYLYQIFYYLSKINLLKKMPDDNDNDYVNRAIAFIEKNYSYGIKVRDIVEATGIERSYLYRLFMHKTKISPQQYLIMYRINMSLELLKRTSLTITQIALSCGFCDPSIYCRHFKKIVKRTPLSYRKNVSPISQKEEQS